MAENLLAIEVAYALPERQWLLSLQVEQGTTVEQAIIASGLLAQCPEIDLARNQVGVFGQVCSLQAAVQNDDRIEIYRPLQQDPMAARRERAVGTKG